MLSSWIRETGVTGSISAVSTGTPAGWLLRRAPPIRRPPPPRADWARSVALTELGDVQVARGQAFDALSTHRESLALVERFASANPADRTLQHDLTVSHDRVGDVLNTQGDAAGAEQLPSVAGHQRTTGEF